MIIKHAFVSPKTEQSDPTLVGPNEWNAQHSVITNSRIVHLADYQYSIVSTGSLTVGANVITPAVMPQGLALNGYLYISGGTGTPELVQITGLTPTTISFTCAYAHTGAWTIQSGVGGFGEVITVNGYNTTIMIPKGITTLYTGYQFNGSVALLAEVPGATIQICNNFPNTTPLGFSNGGLFSIVGITFDGNKANNPTTLSAAIWISFTQSPRVENCIFNNWNVNSVVSVQIVSMASINNNSFNSNVYHCVALDDTALGATNQNIVSNNQFKYDIFSISSITNSTPPVVTTTVPHNLLNNQSVGFYGTGILAYSFVYNVTVLSPTTFSLNGVSAAGASSTGIAITGNFSVLMHHQQFSIVTGNSCTGGGEAIQIHNCHYCNVAQNTIFITSDAGITVFGDSGEQSIRNVVSENVIIQTAYEGLYVGDSAASNLMSGNLIISCGQFGIANRSSGIVVWGTGSSLNDVEGGISSGNLEYGLKLSNSTTNNYIKNIDMRGNVAPIHDDGTTTGNIIIDFSNTVRFAQLSNWGNGSTIMLLDGTAANPVAGGGSGCLAKRLNGVWVGN